jgi:predicted O-linked N-acetylglucosamine transferase (SPINDLY family)
MIFFLQQPQYLAEKLRQRLAEAFARAGLDFGRYVAFVPKQTRPVFYGLMKRADVFLDTIGFSGFNTAMQAVECGLPIVTREGRFMRGRFASGILKRMGLRELVAGTEDEYVELAVKLAQDVGYRDQIRARIGASREVLYEDRAPIRALEEFLTGAIART